MLRYQFWHSSIQDRLRQCEISFTIFENYFYFAFLPDLIFYHFEHFQSIFHVFLKMFVWKEECVVKW